jgi:DNA-binding CsgD family transcriptional regulator
MAQTLDALTQKEKQTLRLLLAGHDAKSMARHLDLSVHTVNERLRDARRKLSVSSSKEAARLLREAEGGDGGGDPESVGDKRIGDAGEAAIAEQGAEPSAGFATSRKAWAIGGIAMISLAAIAALALSGAPDTAQDQAAAPAPAAAQAAPAARSSASQAALQWLALVDAGNWPESWAATASSFRRNNTVEAWQSASLTARVPLGRVLSRSLTSEESIPAPPAGLQLVRFRTSFANRPEAVETLSLSREGEGWRVAGYFIE